jgi:hypothetical protein
MPLAKIGYPKEPKLHVHHYVVTVLTHKKDGAAYTKFHYCVNLKEVKAVAKKAKKGSVIEVFKADHNFVQAYYKE